MTRPGAVASCRLPVASCEVPVGSEAGKLVCCTETKRFCFSCKMTETSVNGFGLSGRGAAWVKLSEGRRTQNGQLENLQSKQIRYHIKGVAEWKLQSRFKKNPRHFIFVRLKYFAVMNMLNLWNTFCLDLDSIGS